MAVILSAFDARSEATAGDDGAMVKANPESRKWWILCAMCGAGGLILLDETVIGIALPTIERDIGMSMVAGHWVVNAYLLVFAGFAAAGGKMGDIIGLNRAFSIGVAAFGLGSLAAGSAGAESWLIAARAVQGFGAAVIFPATIAIVAAVFPTAQRGTAIGILLSAANIFLAAGPLVGGFLIETFSWRWIFWVNVPIVALVKLAMSAAWPREPRKDGRPGIDYAGLLTLAAALGMVVFAMMQGASWGWTHAVILGFLLGGALCIALFAVIEQRKDAPLIEVDLFRDGSFTAYNLVLFSAQVSKMAVVVFGALYLQHVLRMGPLTAGLCLLAAVVGSPVFGVPAGRLIDRVGPRGPALLGLASLTLGMIWIGGASVWDSYPLLLPGLVLWGAALPFCYAAPLRAVMSAVPVAKQGQASGISITTRLLGATIGMAACSTLFAMTGSYQAVFLGTAVLMAAALIFGWLVIGGRVKTQPV
jgi:EmrB/QacA subfamily drug resistance transporter